MSPHFRFGEETSGFETPAQESKVGGAVQVEEESPGRGNAEAEQDDAGEIDGLVCYGRGGELKFWNVSLRMARE